MIDEKKLELRRELYEGRVEIVPIKNNLDMISFVAMDIEDYAAIQRRFEEACRK